MNATLAHLPIDRQVAMAAQEMGQLYHAMTQDMGYKLSGYYRGLQQKYGDQRANHDQEQQMQLMRAQAHHADVVGKSEANRDTYQRKTIDNREKHRERMTKRQGGRIAAEHPQSEASVQHDQTPPPKKRPAPRQKQARPSPS